MKSMSRNTNKILAYVLIPIVFTVVFGVVLLLGFRGMFQNMMAEWRGIFLAGAPEYQYEGNINTVDLPKEGIITSITYPTAGEQYGKISCERIELQIPLYYGDTDEILEQGAGTYMRGAVPGEQSGILIGAHDTTYFAELENISKGDMIAVETVYGSFQYEVTDIRIADVMDTSAYELDNGQEQLILYTCYPFGSMSKLRSERYYVYADKVSGPQLGE